MLNTENRKCHCPQEACDLRKHMRGKEITTKGYNKFSSGEALGTPCQRDSELSLKGCKR